MPTIPLAGGFNTGSSIQFNTEECQNLVPINIKSNGGKGQYKLRSVFGIEYLGEIMRGGSVIGSYTVSPNKYSINGAERLLVFISSVSGLEVWEVFEDDTISFIDSSPEATDSKAFLKIADNGEVVCIVSGLNGWFFNLDTDSLDLITDQDFPDFPIDVVFLDTYFIWLDNYSSTGYIYISDNYATDPANCVNALDFTVAESQPDNSLRLQVLNNELVVFGNKTIEFFYNSGSVDFPFERNSGATQNVGCRYGDTVTKVDDSIYFVGENDQGVSYVYRLNGYSVGIISNQAISKVIDDISYDESGISLVISSYGIKEEGSNSYALNIDYGNALTYFFDIGTGIWHTRKVIKGNGSDIFYGSRYKANAFGFNYYFYKQSIPINSIVAYFKQRKDLYVIENIDPNTQTKETINIERIRTMQHITNENKDIIYSMFELDMQKGVGNADDPSPDIKVYMSKDGGETFGNPKSISIGEENAFRRRVRTRRLGRARDAVFKIESNAPVKQEWFNAYITYEALRD